MAGKQFPLVVHATHEAHVKIGGIGAVLEGLLSAPSYNAAVGRTILAGPMNVWNQMEMQRLIAPGNHLNIIYSSWHGVNEAPEALAGALRGIEQNMGVHLLYGRRGFGPAGGAGDGSVEHEVILVDAQGINGNVINSFKFYCWDRWGLDSARYETMWDWEYGYYMNAAEPLFAALEAVTADLPDAAGRHILAHDWVGLPVVFSALLHGGARYKTAYYAHEVAIVRRLVEDHPGHDTRFYNALHAGLAQGQNLDAVFGDQSHSFRQAVMQRAGVCNRLFAVGEPVLEELRFLGGVVGRKGMDLVYNGVPFRCLDLDQKLHSRDLMLQYAENLLGYRPDYVFTHVGRMVVSKAFWRDLRVLEHLDGMLAAEGKRAVLFIVATADPNGRLPSDVFRWEAEYGWPVGHRADNGDLRREEDPFFFHAVEPFQWGHSHVRAVLVNQFGWSRDLCGTRMPAAMTFSDLRNGTDLEFGQSIYEPFGIAQVEPLSAGALSVVSNVCGCVDLVKRAGHGQLCQNLIVADYTTLASGWNVRTPWDALWIDQGVRDAIEAAGSYHAARKVMDNLPRTRDDMVCRLEAGQTVAAGMSWDVVARDYLCPALARL